MQGLLSARLPRRSRPLLPSRCCRFLETVAQPTLNAHEVNETMAETRSSPHPKLWAMHRASTLKADFLDSQRKWRITGSIRNTTAGLPSKSYNNFLIYLDKIQIHQFWWKLGSPRFLCTKFLVEIYSNNWDHNAEESTVIARVEVYPHVVNMKDDEIINLLFEDPERWGKRCPITFLGEQECIGLKKGGHLKKDLTFLCFQCDHDLDLPDVIVDISRLDIGDKVLIDDLDINLKLSPNLKPDTVICEVSERG